MGMTTFGTDIYLSIYSIWSFAYAVNLRMKNFSVVANQFEVKVILDIPKINFSSL